MRETQTTQTTEVQTLTTTVVTDESSNGVSIRLDEAGHLSDEVVVVRRADGSVLLTVLVGLNEAGDPEECFAEIVLPAAAWQALRSA